MPQSTCKIYQPSAASISHVTLPCSIHLPSCPSAASARHSLLLLLKLRCLQELQQNLERLTQELRSTRLERQHFSEQLRAANAALAEAQATVQAQAVQLTAAKAAAEQAGARCGDLEVQLQGIELRCAELKAELAEKANEVGVSSCKYYLATHSGLGGRGICCMAVAVYSRQTSSWTAC